MTTIQNIILYMWFVPVLGFIILPLLGSFYGLLYRVIDRSRLHDIRGFISLNNRSSASTGKAENRGRLRIHLEEASCCVDEESDCCKALVSDISKQGICLRNIPRKMFKVPGPFRVVFRTRQNVYNLIARPIWKRKIGKGYVLGAQIDQIPTGWKKLVKGLSQSLAAEPA